jgi:hypothetical protein
MLIELYTLISQVYSFQNAAKFVTRRAFSTSRIVHAQQVRTQFLILVSYTTSVVGIATGYGFDGPGIESRWGRDFLHLCRLVLRPTQPPLQWVPDLSWG